MRTTTSKPNQERRQKSSQYPSTSSSTSSSGVNLNDFNNFNANLSPALTETETKTDHKSSNKDKDKNKNAKKVHEHASESHLDTDNPKNHTSTYYMNANTNININDAHINVNDNDPREQVQVQVQAPVVQTQHDVLIHVPTVFPSPAAWYENQREDQHEQFQQHPTQENSYGNDDTDNANVDANADHHDDKYKNENRQTQTNVIISSSFLSSPPISPISNCSHSSSTEKDTHHENQKQHYKYTCTPSTPSSRNSNSNSKNHTNNSITLHKNKNRKNSPTSSPLHLPLPPQPLIIQTKTQNSPHRYPYTKTSKSITQITSQSISKSAKSIHTITTDIIPNAAQELISTTARKAFHYSRLSYSNSKMFGKHQLNYSELGNRVGGYDQNVLKEGIRHPISGEVFWSMKNNTTATTNTNTNANANANRNKNNSRNHPQKQQKQQQQRNGYGWEDEWDKQRLSLPPFSSLNWIDRQLVKEWRTCDYLSNHGHLNFNRENQMKIMNHSLRKKSKNNNNVNGNDNDNQSGNQNDNGNGNKSGDDGDSNCGDNHEKESKEREEQTNQESSKPLIPDFDLDHHLENYNDIHMDMDNDHEHDDEHQHHHDPLEEADFLQARKLVPKPIPRPPWENATSCYACRKHFSSTRLRHHCRLCGRSYCHSHSKWTHRLPHLGYDTEVPERTCSQCKQYLDSQNLAERIAWRMARCRDYLISPYDLCPYFETGVDTVEDAAARLTKAAIKMAKSIPLGAQATVAVETLDVLRKHGLKGVYGLILRKEFMAAADLLCKVTGINKKAWPLSVHELSAAIFYALAQHRALRGVDPEREHRIHAFKVSKGVDDHELDNEHEGGDDDDDDNSVPSIDVDTLLAHKNNIPSSSIELDGSDHLVSVDDNDEEAGDVILWSCKEPQNIALDETDNYNPLAEEGVMRNVMRNNNDKSLLQQKQQHQHQQQRNLNFEPVCDPVSDSLLSSLIFYAPVAMDFIYAPTEVDMQLLAAQQGWRLVYAHLKQNVDGSMDGQVTDMPASALFVHTEQKIACFTIRGTATINDVVIDIRALPVQFPDSDMISSNQRQQPESEGSFDEEDWTQVMSGQGLALCGMAGATYNLFRENIDALLLFAMQGYRIRLVGHSLGGAAAALLGVLVRREFEKKLPSLSKKDFGNLDCNNERTKKGKQNIDEILRVYSYGSPACVDAGLSDFATSYVTNCVLHDDVIPRLTPTSIRALLKHLLVIRETWVKEHLTDDLMAITERAKTAWAPRLRNGFTLMSSKKPSLRVYKKLKAKGCSLHKKFSGSDNKKKIIAESSTHKIEDVVEDIDGKTPLNCDEQDEEDALYYEGDCFYEAEGSLIEHSDEENEEDDTNGIQRTANLFNESDQITPQTVQADTSNVTATAKGSKSENFNSESSPAVLLKETPLPRMFVPGKIVHIYTHRGGYKLAHVPRAFRELRRISLAGNMLNDHMSKSYYEALLECKSIRRAKEGLPQWTGFHEEETCSCCASRFTWASTSDSEAQEARDKHNCRSCGALVCDPCSSNRTPVSDIGINMASRVCDRCYHNMGAALTDNIALTRSFMEDDEKEKGFESGQNSSSIQKKELCAQTSSPGEKENSSKPK